MRYSPHFRYEGNEILEELAKLHAIKRKKRGREGRRKEGRGKEKQRKGKRGRNVTPVGYVQGGSLCLERLWRVD